MSRAVDDSLEILLLEDENSSDETSSEEAAEEMLQYHVDEQTPRSLERRITVARRLLQQKSQSRSLSSIKENICLWKTTPDKRSEFVQYESLSPEMCGKAKDARTPLDYWSLLLTDAIIDQIVSDTNKEIEVNHMDVDERKTTSLEIKALIALFYIGGVVKPPCDMWYAPYHPQILTVQLLPTVTETARFEYLKRKLIVHLSDDIAQKDENECSAENRDVWKDFLDNCQRYYVPSQYCTVGKQLLNDLDIVMTLNDASGYMINAMFLKPNVETEPMENVAGYYVRQLSRPIHGSGRNITMDNWFTSMDIVDKMYTKYQLTITGAINKDDEDIPQSFKEVRPPGSVLFGLDKNKMLASYTSRKRELNLIVSSLNQDTGNDKKTGEPSVVVTYNNQMKTGTRLFNQLCRRYTVSTQEKTDRRRSLHIFYSMLDQACVNSFILYNLNSSNTLLSLEKFSMSLSDSLLKFFLKKRDQSSESNRDIGNCSMGLIRDEK